MKRIFWRFKELNEADFRVLSVIEAGLRRGKFVPFDDLSSHTRLDGPDLRYRLGKLLAIGLIGRRSTPYEGFQLLPPGYDFLAIKALVERNQLEKIGDRIAVGKESEVYEALGPNGESLVIKLHRLGTTSFQNVIRLRGYLGQRRHFTWVYAARLAAEREFEALGVLSGHVKVPRPVGQNRNALLMTRFDGRELAQTLTEDPESALESILADVLRAHEMNVIHGDLSEFNVLMNGEEFAIIDWPQWVGRSHPQAKKFFERDLENLLSHFRRKYGLEGEKAKSEILRSITWPRKNTSS